MKKENIVFKETYPLLKEKYQKEQCTLIMEYAKKEYDKLLRKNCDEPKAVKAQTVNNIYPCISLYRGLLKNGIEKADAIAFLDWSYSKRADVKTESIRKMMHIPNLYKLYPAIFKWVAQRQFGTAAGFKAKFYDVEKGRTKFDMTKCLYCDICKREGCPEIVTCFCHTDDVNNGKLHPNLCWNRTKIMGDGGDCCDFDIYIIK